MPLGTKVGLGPAAQLRHVVLEGTQLPLHPKRHSPLFSTNVYCGQTAGWVKVPFGMAWGMPERHSAR